MKKLRVRSYTSLDKPRQAFWLAVKPHCQGHIMFAPRPQSVNVEFSNNFKVRLGRVVLIRDFPI
jgi:hypothetical protein